MNRAIKFRVWDLSLKKFLSEQELSNFWILPWFGQKFMEWRPEFDGEMVFEPKKETFVYQQFTGVLDKRGAEIYEGDLIFVDQVVWEVVFDRSAFLLFLLETENDPMRGILLESYQDCEIVGNIFENPDL